MLELARLADECERAQLTNQIGCECGLYGRQSTSIRNPSFTGPFDQTVSIETSLIQHPVR